MREDLHVLSRLVALEVVFEWLQAIGVLREALIERWGLISWIVLELVLVPLELGLLSVRGLRRHWYLPAGVLLLRIKDRR